MTDLSFDTMIADWYAIAHTAVGSKYTMLSALSQLPGKTAVEAVKIANKYARQDGRPTVTITEFKTWLPEFLSKYFAQKLEDKAEVHRA